LFLFGFGFGLLLWFRSRRLRALALLLLPLLQLLLFLSVFLLQLLLLLLVLLLDLLLFRFVRFLFLQFLLLLLLLLLQALAFLLLLFLQVGVLLLMLLLELRIRSSSGGRPIVRARSIRRLIIGSGTVCVVRYVAGAVVIRRLGICSWPVRVVPDFRRATRIVRRLVVGRRTIDIIIVLHFAGPIVIRWLIIRRGTIRVILHFARTICLRRWISTRAIGIIRLHAAIASVLGSRWLGGRSDLHLRRSGALRGARRRSDLAYLRGGERSPAVGLNRGLTLRERWRRRWRRGLCDHRTCLHRSRRPDRCRGAPPDDSFTLRHRWRSDRDDGSGSNRPGIHVNGILGNRLA